jgi:hypothetical protein
MTRMLSLAGVALAAAVAATAAPVPQNATGSPFVVAEYMRAVPGGTANHCTRVCVKARDMGGKAEPVCVEWKKVC